MQEKTFSNKNMYILVSKDFRPNAIEQNRITVHTKKDIIDKIMLSMKTNFFLLKLPSNEIDSFSENYELSNIDIEKILDAEAAKFIKKPYNKNLDPILNNIIQVG